jgi:hypothetical protein
MSLRVGHALKLVSGTTVEPPTGCAYVAVTVSSDLAAVIDRLGPAERDRINVELLADLNLALAVSPSD